MQFSGKAGVTEACKTAACHWGVLSGEPGQHALLADNGLPSFSKCHSRNPLQLSFRGETLTPPGSSHARIYIPLAQRGDDL